MILQYLLKFFETFLNKDFSLIKKDPILDTLRELVQNLEEDFPDFITTE